jgi:uncharacterized protein YegL
MAADGKIQALNAAVREMLPHLVRVGHQNPHAELLFRALRFGTGAAWHVPVPTPVEQVRWPPLEAGGYTDLGAALGLLATHLTTPPMEERALPPALVLVSDGQPTDDLDAGLAQLRATPFGAAAIRLAVAIGNDADLGVLRRFIGLPGVEPFQASNPEQLVETLRWASTHVSRMASELAPRPQFPAPQPADRLDQW